MGLRTTVRLNLAALLNSASEGTITGPATVLELEAISGIGKTTIYRILAVEDDYLLSLTTLVKLAAAYELPVWQFLYPQLDPAHRPRVLSAAEIEEYEQWHIVYLQVQAIAHGRPDADDRRASGAGDGNPALGKDSSAKSLPHKRQKYPRP